MCQYFAEMRKCPSFGNKKERRKVNTLLTLMINKGFTTSPNLLDQFTDTMKIQIEVNTMEDIEGSGNDNPVFLDFLKVYHSQLLLNHQKNNLVKFMSDLCNES